MRRAATSPAGRVRGVATAALNLSIGATIGSLVSSIGRSAVRAVKARTARRGYTPRMSPGFPAPQLDVEVLADEVAEFLATVPVADGVGAKLSRLLNGFLEAEVLPQAERAADLGLDPTPFLAVVSDVLRLYAVALERPDAGVR